jgi:hypothetical protein
MHISIFILILVSFIFKSETQGVTDIQEVVDPVLQDLPLLSEPVPISLEPVPTIVAEPVSVAPVEPVPVISIEPVLQPVIEPVSIEPVLQPVIEPVSIEPVLQPVVEPVSIEPVLQPVVEPVSIEPVLQPVIEPVSIEPVLQPVIEPVSIQPVLPELPVVPIIPKEPEPNPEPQNDELEHSTPESIASAEIIRKNGEAIKAYLNNKFINIISIDTEIRVMLLANFITVYSDLEFGPDITNDTMVDYCEEFKHQIEVISNRTFDSCDLPEGTLFRPGNVVTMQIQSAPSSSESGAIGLACSLLIIALSSVFIIRL